MAKIPRIGMSEFGREGIGLLEDAGCLVVHGVTTEDQRSALRSELGDAMQRTPVATVEDPTTFYPGHTRRVISLITLSRTAREFVMHPMVKSACDHILLPNCSPDGRYQLHVTAAVEIGPGAREQKLHREEDTLPFFPLPRPHLIVATMWAISDFTAQNGATRLVPGSHKWGPDRRPEPDEILAAEMPAGSVLFWLGGTLHGGGANTSTQWRYGVILTYSLGWLRQEENQSLAVSPAVANTLPPQLQDMIGYTPNGALGFFAADGVVTAEIEGSGQTLVDLNLNS
jgi:hypothetical protein